MEKRAKEDHQLGCSLLRLLAQGTQPFAHPVLSDRLRPLRACSGRAEIYSVSKKRRGVSTKTEREGARKSSTYVPEYRSYTIS